MKYIPDIVGTDALKKSIAITAEFLFGHRVFLFYTTKKRRDMSTNLRLSWAGDLNSLEEFVENTLDYKEIRHPQRARKSYL